MCNDSLILLIKQKLIEKLNEILDLILLSCIIKGEIIKS
ncbi:Uncharacterised protein [Streptococcus dysgalactiae subsp. equisimilis]|uniref:Uncharacterized protein n=1 Tax=Streptococcus dysgalactiae subsp. equisimilis TaxID=119602 RepID=A0A9X8T0W9_STREQ|nr:Uncharacterised protein [Streptococcus dysgalactiae subsp. equisimilis]VEF06484.1 Uncharacterised protein [Streptococcus dysgalactiae subsp. equisimilis]